jgi:hypothetical protein
MENMMIPKNMLPQIPHCIPYTHCTFRYGITIWLPVSFRQVPKIMEKMMLKSLNLLNSEGAFTKGLGVFHIFGQIKHRLIYV